MHKPRCSKEAVSESSGQAYLTRMTSSMACALLIHIQLPDTFWYHAMVYATHIFNVLPLHGVKNKVDYPTAPYEIFFGKKPCIARFQVFGCPVINRHWKKHQSSQGKQTERGYRGIFIGILTTNKGYMIYCLGSRNIVTAEDATFDELFMSAIALNWQQHRDNLAL